MLSQFVEYLVLTPFLGFMTFNTLLFIDFFFQFGFLALLWFFVVPKGMRLPEMSDNFRDYTKMIHLSTTKPLFRNILVGVGSFIIFGAVVLIGAITLGNYTFDPSILFDNLDPYRFFTEDYRDLDGFYLYICLFLEFGKKLLIGA
ncbi:MAG: hypothetical protein ACFE75_09975 [Candidatus Hodarchaeota archaeon]